MVEEGGVVGGLRGVAVGWALSRGEAGGTNDMIENALGI